MIRLIKNPDNYLSKVEEDIAATRTLEELQSYYSRYLARYKELDSMYGFTEYLDEDYIFQQLEDQYANINRPLFGIPFGVKDVFNTKVLPTAMGSELWKNFKPGNNSRVVDEIYDSGGVLFAKTTTAEFAVHFISPKKTLNPYGVDRITGTSSSGSAVAVSCGALPIALGTQTAGSIIRPASFCGVNGFKPSFGAIDRTGVLKTNDTFDTIGLLGSDLGGIRKAFHNIITKGKDYPYSSNYYSFLTSYKSRIKDGVRDLRIGVVSDAFHNYVNYDDYVKTDFSELLAVLAKDLNLVSLKGVDFINEIHPLHEAMYSKSLSYYFQEEMKRHEYVSDVMTDMIRRGEKVTVEEYVTAAKRQPVLRAQFDAVFKDYDFLITPATGSVAPLLGEWEIPDTCLIWTFLGYPTVTLPLFFNTELGLPFGLQLVAKKFDDFSLLDFAGHIERVFA